MGLPPAAAGHAGRRILAALVATAAVVVVSGCAADVVASGGPAEVSVVKKTVPTPTGGQQTLARLDPAVVPGAAAVEWGQTLEHVWLPEAAEVTAGIDGASGERGTAYLSVPADFEVTDLAVRAGQDRSVWENYSAIEVTEETATEPGAVGTVIDGAVGGTRYSVTVSADPDGRDGFSVVMVMWYPDAPVSIPPGEDDAPVTDPSSSSSSGTPAPDASGSR